MNVTGLFLCLLLVVTTCKADMVNARGAEKRKHFAEHPRTDIEDIIRAQDDPDFLQFLKAREREEAAQKIAALNYENVRRAEEAAYEKARIDYINNEEKNADSADELKRYRQYLKEKRAWRLQQEKDRREYASAEHLAAARRHRERIARLQKYILPQRLPASR